MNLINLFNHLKEILEIHPERKLELIHSYTDAKEEFEEDGIFDIQSIIILASIQLLLGA